MNSGIKTLRWLALIGYLGLFVLVPLWHIWLAPSSLHSVEFQLLLYWLPLFFPLLGIIRGKPYTHAWANFILMWYFLHSLTVLYTAPEVWVLALLELILTTMAFIGCTYFARLQGRALGLTIPKLKSEPEFQKPAKNPPDTSDNRAS